MNKNSLENGYRPSSWGRDRSMANLFDDYLIKFIIIRLAYVLFVFDNIYAVFELINSTIQYYLDEGNFII